MKAINCFTNAIIYYYNHNYIRLGKIIYCLALAHVCWLQMLLRYCPQFTVSITSAGIWKYTEI